jgi:hypothetical protein
MPLQAKTSKPAHFLHTTFVVKSQWCEYIDVDAFWLIKHHDMQT